MKLLSTTLAEGTRVSGKYCGDFSFTGVISHVRFAPRNSYYYEVKLDSPICVYGGQLRNSISFYSGDSWAKEIVVV